MTLTVTIKNHSGTLNAIIEKVDVSEVGAATLAELAPITLLPGESVDVVVHKRRQIRINEELGVLPNDCSFTKQPPKLTDRERAGSLVEKAIAHAEASSVAAAGDDENTATAHSQAAAAACSAVTALAQAAQLR